MKFLSLILLVSLFFQTANAMDKTQNVREFNFEQSRATFSKNLIPISTVKRQSKDSTTGKITDIDVPVYYKKNGCLIYGWWSDGNETIPKASVFMPPSADFDNEGGVPGILLFLFPVKILPDSEAIGPNFPKQVYCLIQENTTIAELEKRLENLVTFY